MDIERHEKGPWVAFQAERDAKEQIKAELKTKAKDYKEIGNVKTEQIEMLKRQCGDSSKAQCLAAKKRRVQDIIVELESQLADLKRDTSEHGAQIHRLTEKLQAVRDEISARPKWRAELTSSKGRLSNWMMSVVLCQRRNST